MTVNSCAALLPIFILAQAYVERRVSLAAQVIVILGRFFYCSGQLPNLLPFWVCVSRYKNYEIFDYFYTTPYKTKISFLEDIAYNYTNKKFVHCSFMDSNFVYNLLKSIGYMFQNNKNNVGRKFSSVEINIIYCQQRERGCSMAI